ncbi:MAG: sodium/proton-translocating pyrophosphatase [Oscillospiraceae bacterium]
MRRRSAHRRDHRGHPARDLHGRLRRCVRQRQSTSSPALEGHGKGSDAHKASVVGDTVGDTRKDVVGVALDIFIKTMSTVANTLATVFQHITLIR